MDEAGAGEQQPAFTVSGYDVLELLGYGSSGEVWRGRCRTTGAQVALKRVRADGDPTGGYRLRREAAVLARIRHPHVLRLRTVVADGDHLVLVLDLAGGGSLARLVAQHGPLPAGQVVTVGVPLAQALAEVHEQGVLHGDVSPANVLFTVEGCPLLSDLGVARLVGAGREALHAAAGFADPAGDEGPAGDVHGLAATCVAALTGHPPYDETGHRRTGAIPEGLAEVLERALHPDPARRPSAAEFAVALYEAAPARPVRLPGTLRGSADPASHDLAAVGNAELGELDVATRQVRRPVPVAPPVEPPRPARRHRSVARARRFSLRGVLLAAVVGLTLVVAAATGIAWARAGEGDPPATIAAPAGPSEPAAAQASAAREDAQEAAEASSAVDWREALARLDVTRSQAYEHGDLDRLASVYVPGSPAARADAQALQELVDAGLRAVGVRLEPLAVKVVGESPGEAKLRIRDVMGPYELRDATGTVQRRPGRGSATWLVTLQRTADDGDWLVASVTRLGANAG